jgi:hypothetical protein
VRNNGTNTLYVDGTSVGTSTQDYAAQITNNIISIGGAPNYAFYIHGWIDDFRQTQSAVYTANFTPPTAALTAITNTALLYNFNTAFDSIPFGQFDGFNVSGNEITSLRAEGLALSSSPGYNQYVSWVKYYGPQYQYIPGAMEQGNLSSNSLNAAALDQFYTDLLTGTGSLYVESNAGTVSDTPSIATTKGYTVYGSA